MIEVKNSRYVPEPGVALAPGDLNEMLEKTVVNYISSGRSDIDAASRAAVVNFMINEDHRPWHHAFMVLNQTATQRLYDAVCDYIKDSAVRLCNAIDFAFDEVCPEAFFREEKLVVAKEEEDE
jgi:hypothetical protein